MRTNFFMTVLLCFFCSISVGQISLSFLKTDICCFGECNGNICLTVTGGNPPLSFNWSNGSTTKDLFNLCAGTYCVTVTDALNATASDCITLTEPSQLTCSISSSNVSCFGLCDGKATASAAGGSPPYTYHWSYIGNDKPTIDSLCIGNYECTVTDATASTAMSYITIEYSKLLKIYINNQTDSISLCKGDSAEFSLQCWPGTPPVTFKWSNGASTSTFSYIPLNTEKIYCTITDNYGLTATGYGKVIVVPDCAATIKGTVYNDENNNGKKDTGENGMQGVIVQVSPSMYFSATDINGNYTIFSNIGTYNVSIPHPPIHNSINPPNYTVKLDTVGETDSLIDFGIYAPGYIDLQVILTNQNASRPGFDVEYYLQYSNKGNKSVSGSAGLRFDKRLEFKSCSQPPDYISGDSLRWDLTNLLPGYCNFITITFRLSDTVPLGRTLHSVATILPVIGDTLPENNVDSVNQLVTGAYDPNDKEVLPSKNITPEEASAGKPLTYVIRFQNTGTDTAFNIKITDTLSSLLDIPSMEVLASSHPCTFKLHGKGIAEFSFSTILLPDSNVNEPLSHGFVKYRIIPKTSLKEGDVITNTAYIYFDFNKPVQTNTTVTKIEKVLEISEPVAYPGMFTAYPNPFRNEVRIHYNLNHSSQISLCIYNLTGEKITILYEGNQAEGDHSFSFNPAVFNLKQGVYIVSLQVNGMSDHLMLLFEE